MTSRYAVGRAVVVIVVLVILVIGGVAGYFYYQSTATTTPANLTIGTSTATTTGGIVAVAQAEGFFKQEGINATIDYFASGAQEQNAIASGSIPIGITGETPFLSMVTGGVPVVMVATAYEGTATHLFIVNKNLNVTSPQGLAGLTLGTVFGSDGDYLTRYFMKSFNLDSSNIKLVNLQPAALVTAYKQGQINGISFLWVPPIRQAISAVPSTMIAQNNETFFGGATQAWNATVYGTVVARTDWLKQNPTVMTEFLNAMVKASDFMSNPANKAKAIQDIAPAISSTVASVTADWSGVTFSMAITPTVAKAYQTEIGIMYALNEFKSNVNIQGYVDSQPLAGINSNLVSYTGSYSS